VNQIGFGWTNGVIQELLDKYSQILTAEDGIFLTEHERQHLSHPDKSGSSSLVTHVKILSHFCCWVFLVLCVHMPFVEPT
jgi:hypothetical protein